MGTEESIYISVSNQSYKQNKSNILNSQANLLNILKHIHHLKVLSREKNDLKAKILKSSLSIINDLDSLQEKMPHPKIQKSKVRQKDVKGEMPKKVEDKATGDIDKELLKIQEKLRELNS